MNLEDLQKLGKYEVVKQEKIDEIDSLGTLLVHKKTKAKILLFENKDDNKVFSVGFRTPVSDDTGVPHIIEHTVLCGSEKYPLKDPFMELAKGSLNTFLNAMTYPDKTIYPVASTNDQDYKNLMSVYMDAVFKPNIYKEENIFKQEGWHYELDSVEDSLTINGIVYSEMKGVYSSVDGILDRVMLQSLFPDNGYRFESGGHPEHIPELTYEDYLDFHKRYYHPSNSYIYMYGDMDMAERLDWIDKEYLSNYDYLEIDSEIPLQKPFDEVTEIENEYSIGDDENEDENYVFSKNFVIGESNDAKLNISMLILDYALMDMPGAPLKQALIDAEIGKDIFGQYENDIRQPIYSIVSKYSNKDNKEKFIKTLENTLEKIVEEGIDKKALKAGLATNEFRIREADFGRYPKGLMFDLNLMSTWLYDDENPWGLLKTNEIFEELKKDIETDYFEQLVRKYFIDNKHSSIVTMIPKKGYTEGKELELKSKLARKQSSLDESEIQKIVEETKALKEYQKEPSAKEAEESIPLLEISDINPNPRPFVSKKEEKDGITFIHSDIFTNKIAYLDFVCISEDVPKEYLNYLGLVKRMLASLDTENYSYKEFNAEIDLNLGGFYFDSSTFLNENDEKIYYEGMARAKMLYENIEKAFEYIKEVILRTKYNDFKRMKEILEETKSSMFSLILQSGDSVARTRALSYYAKNYFIKDQVSGIAFYEFVCNLLENYDERKVEFAKKFEEVINYLFNNNKIIVNYAGDSETYEKVKTLSKELRSMLNNPKPCIPWEFEEVQRNEGFITPGQVQYVSRVGNFFEDERVPYDGSLFVLNNIMRTEYLWNNIRVLGGAYGCSMTSTRNGNITFASYRDPNLKSTSDTFLKAADYIEKFEADERQLRKFIIGSISNLDRPLSPADISAREYNFYVNGVTYDILKKEREKLLKTTNDDIKALAPLVRKALCQGNICVVGSKSSIEENKELFKEIKNV